MSKLADHDVADISLAGRGKKKIEWAGQQMPVVKLVGERLKKEKTLEGIMIGACLHVTSETANLMLALKSAGSDLAQPLKITPPTNTIINRIRNNFFIDPPPFLPGGKAAFAFH